MPREWGTLRRPASTSAQRLRVREYPVPAGTHPHDVAPAPDGTVWYTAQHTGKLGRLDPATGKTTEVPLGDGSAPHGVIVGPDGAAWVTDGGLNAIVRVDSETSAVKTYPAAGLDGLHEPQHGDLRPPRRALVHGAERHLRAAESEDGRDACLPCAGRRRPVWDRDDAEGTGLVRVARGEPHRSHQRQHGKGDGRPPADAGPGRAAGVVGLRGRLWVSEWNAGKVGRYDPATRKWREWRVPGPAQPYAVYVDDKDVVWLTDFGRSGLWRFTPTNGKFTRVPLREGANVRQLLGRPGEVWGAESGTDRLVVVRG